MTAYSNQQRRREDEAKAGAPLLGLLILAMFVLVLWFSPANAGSDSLGAEYTIYQGHPLNHWWPSCNWPDQPFDLGDGSHGVQCVSAPGTLIAVTGTSTVKGKNEVLAVVWCNGQKVWQGEHMTGTVPINVTGLVDANITGPCYVALQALGGYSRSGYEIQLTFFYR